MDTEIWDLSQAVSVLCYTQLIPPTKIGNKLIWFDSETKALIIYDVFWSMVALEKLLF